MDLDITEFNKKSRFCFLSIMQKDLYFLFFMKNMLHIFRLWLKILKNFL